MIKRKNENIISAYPTSYAQKRIYFLEKFEMGRLRNNIGLISRFQQIFSVEKIKDVLEIIFERHEIFRYNFQETEAGELVQFLRPECKLEFFVHDLRDFNSAEKIVQEKQIIDHAMEERFDLEKDTLVRFVLLRLSEVDYVLLVVAHHIIADAWSLSIAANEFFYFSQALFYKQKPFLPPVNIQYKDYAAWEQSDEFQNKIALQEKYWLNHLAGELSSLEIPTDYPRPRLQSYQTALVSRAIDEKLYLQIKSFCAQNNFTPYIFSLGVFMLLLHKLSGEEEIIVGTFSANRDLPELDSVIGIFLNNLAIRSSVSSSLKVQEYFSSLREEVLRAMENKDYPFEQLIEKINLARDLNQAPIFNTVFQMFNSGGHNDLKESIFIKHVKDYSTFDKTLGKFDLSFYIHERNTDWLLALAYDKKLFKEKTISRYLTYYEEVIKAILLDSDKKISQLNYLSEADKNVLINNYNNKVYSFDESKSLFDFFEFQTDQTPEKIALIFDNQKISYQELKEKADKFAFAFYERGLRSGQSLGFFLDRSIDFLAALLASLKLGLVYVPLDKQAPTERIKHICQDADLKFILVDDLNLFDKKIFTAKKIIKVQELLSVEAFSLPRAVQISGNQHLAAVIYTSGSTGKPKGVELSHRGLINQALAKNLALEIKSNDIVAQNLSAGFVASLWQFFSPLFIGATVLIIPDHINQDLPAMIEIISNKQASIWEFGPYLFAWLLKLQPESKIFSPNLKIILTGENTPVHLIQEYFLNYKFRLFNAYGQTECSDDTLISEIKASDSEKITLGYPMINTQVYILDRDSQLVAINVVGEIFISGAGLSLGYKNLSKHTAEVFLPHPFLSGERIYKTGDLARRLEDGTIEYLGRNDKQFKIRGRRLEPGEIENCLAKLPGIKQSLLRIQEGKLVLYFTSETLLNSLEIKNFLKKYFPDYLLPNYFVCLSSFILNRNGKLDVSALPRATEAHMLHAEHKAPFTKTEKFLANVWKDLLVVDLVSSGDDFFVLGGHSLLAVQLMHQMRSAGYIISLPDIFNYSCLHDLADFVDKQKSDSKFLPGGVPLTAVGDYLRVKQRGLQINETEIICQAKIVNADIFYQSLTRLKKRYLGYKIYGNYCEEKNNNDNKYDLEILIFKKNDHFIIHIKRNKKKFSAVEFAKCLLDWQRFYNLSMVKINEAFQTPFFSYPEYYHCIHANLLEMLTFKTKRIIYQSLVPAYDFFLVPNYCCVNEKERRDNDFNALLLGKPKLFMSAEKFGVKFKISKLANKTKAKEFFNENENQTELLMGNNYFLPASPYYHDTKFIDSFLAGRNLYPMNYSIFQKQGNKIIFLAPNLNYFGQISSEDFMNYWKNFKDVSAQLDKIVDFSFQYLTVTGLDSHLNPGLLALYEALAWNIDEYFRGQVIVGGIHSGFEKIFFGAQVWDEFKNDIEKNIQKEKTAIADIVIVDMFKRLQKNSLFLKDLLTDIVALNDDFVEDLDSLACFLKLSDMTFEKLYKSVKRHKIKYEPIMTLLPSVSAQKNHFLTKNEKLELQITLSELRTQQAAIFLSLNNKINKLI